MLRKDSAIRSRAQVAKIPRVRTGGRTTDRRSRLYRAALAILVAISAADLDKDDASDWCGVFLIDCAGIERGELVRLGTNILAGGVQSAVEQTEACAWHRLVEIFGWQNVVARQQEGRA